jgi:hypothetical protein
VFAATPSEGALFSLIIINHFLLYH